MSITRRESRTWSGGNFLGNNWGPYNDGRIPPPTWQGPGAYSSAGPVINQDSALRIAQVWACVQLVSDYIAGLPVATVTKQANGEVTRNGQQPPLLAQPWPEFTQYEWFFAMHASLMLRGNAFGRKMDFDTRGYPRMIQPVAVEHVGVARVDGELAYKFNNKIVPTDEVFHLRAFTIPGHDTGLSPIENFARTLGVNIAAEDYIARFFGDGAHPTAVLQSDHEVTKDQAETIMGRIRQKFAWGNREPVILGVGVKWEQVQVSPNETQFLEAISATDMQIAKMFGLGVCPELVGSGVSGQNITYANKESRDLDLQTYGIMPWTERWCQALTPLVPARPSVVAFDLDAKLKVDTKSRYEAKAIAMRSGAMSANDWRRSEGEPPLPGQDGDRYNWPPYNVKNEADAQAIADDPSLAAPV